MKTAVSSLESYLKKSLGQPSGAKSYSDYVRENGGDYKTSYLSGVKKALTGYKQSLSGYGKTAESLADSGVLGGYAERINDIAKESLSGSLNKLNTEKEAKESQLLAGYSKYLEQYQKQRNNLKQSVTDKLIKEEILNRDALYSYGIGAGLTESEASEVSESVYGALRLKVMGDILRQVAALSLDPERAIMLATDKGLDRDDIETVRERAKEYYSVSYADDDYLNYLESIGNKTTSTFN